MIKKLLHILLLLLFNNSFSQTIFENKYASVFNEAYKIYPEIPKGVLEAVAYSNTHFQHLTHPSNKPESCAGIPNTYGPMGLTLDGENYFNDNLKLVASLSNYSIEKIISSPRENILAYASAYNTLLNTLKPKSIEEHAAIFIKLSELPNFNTLQNFALQSQIYSYYWFLNNSSFQAAYNFPNYKINFNTLFGEENYLILSSTKILINNDSITDTKGTIFQNQQISSNDYPPAIWNPAATCNFSSRNGAPITDVAIHTIQGSYAGCISWFKNCSAAASAHYIVRSFDGQVTQMVFEVDKAWHVKAENDYAIGIEHEGYINDSTWYTNNMYQSSADIVRDISQSGYNINPLRTYYGPSCSGSTPQCGIGPCRKIKGHQMFPNQTHTDPGPNWNWYLYYNLINNNTPITTFTTSTGNFYDTGGLNNNYSNDERTFTLIQPIGATSITLNFNSFNTEHNWDYMFIYDGASPSDSLIGVYSGNIIPSTINSTGGSLLIEFRSDCATNLSGWSANWTSTSLTTPTNENSTFKNINLYPNPFSDISTLNFEITIPTTIKLSISDLLGKVFLNEYSEVQKGNHTRIFNTKDIGISKGVYLLTINYEDQIKTLKMIVQ